MLIKTCTRCGEEKPASLDHFPPHKECRGGIGPYCRPCYRTIQKAFRVKHRARLVVRRRELYALENGQKSKAAEAARQERYPYRFSAERLINGVWARARDLGLPIDPCFRTKAFVEAWLRRQPTCECCGVTFRIGRSGTGRMADNSPSFDRFEPADGYTIANAALICWRCNNIKRNYVEEDLLAVVAWMKRRRASSINRRAA